MFLAFFIIIKSKIFKDYLLYIPCITTTFYYKYQLIQNKPKVKTNP